MDYDDNDSQSQNLHLAGEGNNKFPPVLRSYDLPRFDFDDNLRGHLRFDSLVETEVFLGIESSEDNQWIEEFSRGSTGIAFSSSAAEPCLISRRTNVWSEAASLESVEMLLKSVGQDETTLDQTISKDSDACDELGCMIKPMDPSLKHRDSSLSKVGDDIQPALHTGEIPGKCVDNQLVEDSSQTHEGGPSVHGALEDPNSKNTDIPATERDESKDGKHFVVNENLVEASADQSLDDSVQEDKFASGSEVNTVIPSVQSTCMTSVLVDDEDSTHLKNDIIDKNVDNLERENVGLSPELHIGGKNLVDDTVACVTSHVQKHSASEMQSREEEHAAGNSTANMSEPSGRILEGNSDLHMVEECSKRAGVEILLQTSKSEDIVLSEGKLHDTLSMPIGSDITLKEHENEVSDTGTKICTSLESKVNSTMKLASDAIEKKDLLEIDYHPDKKISSSKSEKSLLLAEDGKGSKDEGEDSHDTLVAGPTKVCEKYIVTEHIDDHKCDRSVSVASKQNTNLPSDCSSADCFDDRSPLVTKGVDSSSFGAGGRVNELASNLKPDVPVSSMLVDCVLLPSDKGMPANTVLDKKEVQVPSSEASFSVVKTSEMTTEKGASCETGEQFSCKIVDQSLLMKNTTTLEGENGDQTLCGVTLEVGKDMHSSSIVSDSTVRKTDGDKALVISEVSTDSAGDASTQLNKTLMNSVPSTSMETSHNTDQNHHKDNNSRLVSEEISGRVAVHQVDVDPAKATSFASVPSSESQTKFHMMESGSSSADLDNPSCGSPIVIRTSEQSQGKIENGVKRSKDQSAVASGVTNEEANKEKSISQDTEGNDATPGDKSFTFEVPPFLGVSEQESGKNWQPFSTTQHDKISPAMEGTPSTSGLSKAGAKAARETSCANLQAPKREDVRGGFKGTSERKTRRTGGKSASKEAAKKGNAAKERTPARESERSDRTSNLSLSSAGTGQLVQSNEMQHYGHIEGGNMKPFGVLSTSVSSLPDLNTSASSSAVFQQPFTDLQQVQLRAQIFVYGALIQGTVPDEAYMISAFGGPDGGRTIWENAWRAGTERVHGKKSLLVSPETPLQSHIGAKTSDQSIKQNTLQSKATSSPASRSTSKGTPTTSIVNPIIPLSSPLWSIRTPSGDALQPTGFPRGAVMDYQLAISPLHPSATRNLIGHNSSWMSQSPFRGPWTPQTSAFDGNAGFPVRPITEAVNSNPGIASVPHSSSMKQVSAVPVVQSGSPANIFAGTPLLDTKKATLKPGHHSADPKPRKRKKSTVPEESGQSIPHFQSESPLATVVVSQTSTPAVITIPATNISKSTDKFITSVSGNYLKKGDQESDQRASLSEETLSKHKNAQKHAEDAAALAAAAVNHSEEIWRQLDKHKNSGLAPDVETKLTSAAVAIAAAAAVAKAAAAAANVSSNAALQAKLMADEALVSSGYRNSTPNNAISDSGKRLSEATPASILKGEDAAASSNSVIVVAREVARRRVEAASAAAKQAENMDAIVKAAELAAEAVSQAGKIVAMSEPFSLAELVEAGPEAYWKVPQASPEPDGAIREQINIGGSMEAPGSSVGHLKEVPGDKREKQDNHRKSPTHREMTRESMEDRSRLTDGGLAPVATSEKDKKGQKRRKASDFAKTKGVASESEIGFESPLMITQTDHEKAGETSKDNNIREGSHVEVLRDGGGSRVAWFLADILNLNDGKAYVCYNELRQEDGDRLKEWVEVEGDRAPRIRCARPSTAMSFEGTRKRRRAAMGDYNWSVGDRVDAWMQNSWWEGVVIEKSKKDETSFTVHFPAQGETSGVKAWLLRPSLMWKKGSWVEWSSFVDNNESSREGDTPQEKRQRLGSPAVEAKGKDKFSKNVDIKESGKPDDTKLLDLSANKEIFNIGKSTRDESKPDSLKMIRTGLKKKGSGVVFGVPKPGKKQKFMEVSKHYVADQSSKTHETSDSAKFTKYLMPQGSEPRGTKNKIEPKRMAVSKPKILKSGKLPSVSSRSIPQKNYLSNTMVSEPESVVASDVSKLEDSVSHAENVSGKPTLMEFRSFSSSDGAAEGPVLFSSVAVSSDAPLKKTSASNAKSERINKGKFAPSGGKLEKIEEKVFNDDTTKTSSEGVEPRRSNRRIQPTSRLLEGLQSSLAISKIPSVSLDKSHKSQSRSMRGGT